MLQMINKICEWLDLDPDDMKQIEWASISCPFHTDSRKSASISFVNDRFKCFAGCDSLSIYQFYDRMLEQSEDEEIENDKNDLPSNPAGINPQENKSNNLDSLFSNDASNIKDELKKFIASRMIPKEFYIDHKAKFIIDRSDNNFGYIVFPHDSKKDFYIGRLFLDLPNKPKYIGPKVNKAIYGLEFLEPGTTEVIIVEGLFTYATIKYSFGFNNVICCLGSTFGPEMAYALADRGITAGFLLFDRDYAGYKGARKAIETAKAFSLSLVCIEHPRYFGSDANDAMMSGLGADYKNWLISELKKYQQTDIDYVSDIFFKNEIKLKSFPTQFPIYNNYLGGGLKEGLHLISGETGVGKSSLALSIATFIADNFNAKVLFCPYEITPLQCWARIASIYDSAAWNEIENNPSIISDETKLKIKELGDKIKIVPYSIEEIEKAAEHFDLIVGDYLQKMPRKDADIRKSINDNVFRLSDLATLKRKIVILVSTINRASYGKENPQYKESGDIEYSAQSSIHISQATGTLLTVSMPKNTRGKKGTFWLKADLAHISFTEQQPTYDSDDDLMHINKQLEK